MRVIVTAVGTSGNALPFLGWSHRLRQRGHEVVVIGNPEYASRVQELGVAFVPLPLTLHGSQGPSRPSGTIRLLGQLAREYADLVPVLFEAIRTTAIPGRTVLASIGWAFASRVASEALKIPLASVVLQPKFVPADPRRQRPIRRWVHRYLTRRISRTWGQPIEEIRSRYGLPPVDNLLSGWALSPDLVLGFFPSWFAPEVVHSPVALRPVGFPLYDGSGNAELASEVREFLDAGDPPVVVAQSTLGTAQSLSFFETAVAALRKSGRRGILLSSRKESIAADLPESIRYFGYVPVSRILPRSAAFLHHGGVGMIAQGLAAGIPQLMVPRVLDQPDNARHLVQLGAGRVLSPLWLNPRRLTTALERILSDTALRETVQQLRHRMEGVEPYDAASELLEQLGAEMGIEDATPQSNAIAAR